MAGRGREYLLAPSMHLGDEIVLEQRDRQPSASKLTFQRADVQPFARHAAGDYSVAVDGLAIDGVGRGLGHDFERAAQAMRDEGELLAAGILEPLGEDNVPPVVHAMGLYFATHQDERDATLRGPGSPHGRAAQGKHVNQ